MLGVGRYRNDPLRKFNPPIWNWLRKRRTKLTERETVSYKEIAHSNMMSIEAIVRLLIRKGLVTEKEILDEIMAIRVSNEKDKN